MHEIFPSDSEYSAPSCFDYETLSVTGAVCRDRGRVRVRGDRACNFDPSSNPTPPPPQQGNPARIYYADNLGEGGGTRALVADAAPESQ